MKESERKYTFNQSHQIEMQTGLIGYLRADMDSNGKGFFSTWNEFNPTLKTEEFKREFDDVINALRLDNKFEKVLYDRDSLRKYCADHPEIKYNDVRNFYGIRVNSDNYAYGQFFQIELMRSELNKSKTHFKNFGRALFGREVKEAEYVKRDKGLLSSFRKGYEKLSKENRQDCGADFKSSD